MNKLILLGRLTASPEMRTTQSGTAMATFTMAVDRRIKQEGQPDADFIRCIAWKKTAETICNYFDKGNRIAVEGHLQTRSYEKDGQRHHATECIVESFDFCESKGSRSNNDDQSDIDDPDFYMMDGDDPPF